MDFCTGVIIFRFGGPDPGQQEEGVRGAAFVGRRTVLRDGGSVIQGFVAVRKIF
jgi:hypothetical protein